MFIIERACAVPSALLCLKSVLRAPARIVHRGLLALCASGGAVRSPAVLMLYSVHTLRC